MHPSKLIKMTLLTFYQLSILQVEMSICLRRTYFQSKLFLKSLSASGWIYRLSKKCHLSKFKLACILVYHLTIAHIDGKFHC